MTLTLNMLRCPDTVPPQTRAVQGGEFAIGRGTENDWVLPDPERSLSRRHCLLAYRTGELAGRRSLGQRHFSERRGGGDRSWSAA